MTDAVALYSPSPAVVAAWNARGYTSLRLEDHAETLARRLRWMDFAAVAVGHRGLRPASRGACASKRG